MIMLELEEQMQKAEDFLKSEFAKIRTGKASPILLDGITVDYYGTQTALSQVASVSTPDATTINISPWEKNLIPDIAKAISEANIGVTPDDDEEGVKLFFPPMTTEQREKSVKVAKSIAEDFKVSIRNIRKESNDKIKKALKDKEITEDESKGAFFIL
jgi:ribosome recycling factor